MGWVLFSKNALSLKFQLPRRFCWYDSSLFLRTKRGLVFGIIAYIRRPLENLIPGMPPNMIITEQVVPPTKVPLPALFQNLGKGTTGKRINGRSGGNPTRVI